MHASSAMRAAGASARVAPPSAARPRASPAKGGRGAAPARAAVRYSSAEAAANELAALKKQAEQAEMLISAGKLAEAEALLGFVVPKVDTSRAGRNKSGGGVIWGVFTESAEEAAAPQAAAGREAAAVAPVEVEPAMSEEEIIASALVAPVVTLDLSRPPPTAEEAAALLQGDEAFAAVRAKALKARLDGTDAPDAFSDANAAHHAPATPLSAAPRPPGLVAYIASLPRDEQLELEPGLRDAMEARRRASESAPAGTAADPELAALQCGCAWLAASRGDYAEADTLYRDALALLRRRAEAAATAAAAAAPKSSGGGLFGALGKLGGGGGGRGPLPAGPAAELQLCLASLAKLAQARGALNEAEALWRDALAAADVLFGAGVEHANAAARDATRALALLAAARGQDTQAAKLFREAAALERALADAANQPLPYRIS